MSTNAKKDIVSKDKLLEAGVYFGHKKDKWNPKMKPYINGVKKGTHIIDIEKSKRTLEFAYSLIKSYAEKGASFVFVGTRKQAKEAVKANALRTNSFYVDERWLGGTLTNSRTIFQRVRRMEELEQLAASNYAGYTKKEGVLFAKELAKLHKNLQGIREMRRKPNVMIVADPSADDIAVKEAQRLGVKVIGIVDTNNDPSSVNVAIPGNDDSVKSVTLILTILADAIAEAKGGKPLFAFQADEAIVLPEELKKEIKARPAFGDRPRRFGDRPDFNRDNREPREHREFRPRTENSDRPARVRTADAKPFVKSEEPAAAKPEIVKSEEPAAAKPEVVKTEKPAHAKVEKPAAKSEVKTEKHVAKPAHAKSETVKSEKPAAAKPKVTKAEKPAAAKPEVVKTEKPATKSVVSHESHEEHDDFPEFTLADLKEKAKEKGIHGYSTMKKAELLAALSISK